MSKVVVTIDSIVLRGLGPAERAAMLGGLQSELQLMASDPVVRAQWTSSMRGPVRLGALPLAPGPSGARRFGITLARAIGRRMAR